MKNLPECAHCLHREDELVCDECETGEGYELDESLVELCEDGCLRVGTLWLGVAR